MYSGNRYFRKNLSMNSTEIMDIDNFKNEDLFPVQIWAFAQK